MSARELRLLSVVAPMLDEEGLAAEFCSRVATSLGDLPYELVIVDDGCCTSRARSGTRWRSRQASTMRAAMPSS